MNDNLNDKDLYENYPGPASDYKNREILQWNKKDIWEVFNDFPKKLWRWISINPDELDESFFEKALIPWSEWVNNEWEKIVGDGNELWTYMSSSESMVQTAYMAKGKSIIVPHYNSTYWVTNVIKIPSCWILYEIYTEWLNIKKPKILKVLEWVKNNGFEGDEFIAEQIPASNYKIKRLTLQKSSYDSNSLKIDIDQNNYQKSLKEGILSIKEKYNFYKEMAKIFWEYLNGLSEKERMNSYKIEKWKKENGVDL